MFKGLQTVVYGVTDIAKAKDWYTQVLGNPPYFDQPSFYVGFNVGGYELGLDPNASPVSKGSTGVVAYWGVDDIHSEYQRLLTLGAREHVAVRDVGEGILVGTVLDPFGNPFGLIHNPHFQRK
jgi:predicted enzyme related to lactoylglutathione lyase